jgi:hypothetical protein
LPSATMRSGWGVKSPPRARRLTRRRLSVHASFGPVKSLPIHSVHARPPVLLHGLALGPNSESDLNN